MTTHAAERFDESFDGNEDEIISPYLKDVSARRSALERSVMNGLSGSMGRLSWAGCRRVGSQLGLAFFAGGKRRRELAIDNVRRALDVNRAQAMRIARRSAQNWGMTSCEFLHLSRATPDDIREYVSLSGLEHLHAALEPGRGAILLMAHFGNWEVLGARLAQEMPISAIVRPLSNATAQEHLAGVRRAVGLNLINKHTAARPALKLLRSGGALCLLPDRHAGPEGILVDLFDRPTRFEAAPARFAMMSGAPIVPVFGVRREPWLSDGRIEGRILPAFSIPDRPRSEREAATLEGTRMVTKCLEDMVRAHPDQWTWMQRRWRDDDIDPLPVIPRKRTR